MELVIDLAARVFAHNTQEAERLGDAKEVRSARK